MKNGFDYLCYAASGIAGFLVTRKLIGMIQMYIKRNFHSYGLMNRLNYLEDGQVDFQRKMLDTRAELIAMNLRLKLIETKVAKLMHNDTITLI